MEQLAKHNILSTVMGQQESNLSPSKSSILALAQEAVKAKLIDRDVLEHLTSLHPQVPDSMKHLVLTGMFWYKTECLQETKP